MELEMTFSTARTARPSKLSCLIFPENTYKMKWDFWIAVVLVFVAFSLPVRIAFYEKDSMLWVIINITIDITFSIDIILTFFCAIIDTENNELITDKR